ncbi:hypothetical protein OSB04_017910 [Centaurea solstitialis]|uniref:Uncharacterized protein n=1 Tax=Centaurea solstitialis TaxID=347529 RepID=A0AA38WIT4_9ASTR|nr:hypothetical protein OSB04_017910 [Centaurea solstitialis]
MGRFMCEEKHQRVEKPFKTFSSFRNEISTATTAWTLQPDVHSSGTVDPRLFYPNFRSDGIFEAVVMKCE